ncbi:hypothetical protein CCR75_003160 [Bremia lactucae]|uniref:Aminotransferase class V domain-containing protein n=1 Tax=Bremia lactucae TaxID=4779 RepID=A0A976IHP9_BRELC|nr:hypothetical protein CCR75_003160 [Bremia lactucae]
MSNNAMTTLVKSHTSNFKVATCDSPSRGAFKEEEFIRYSSNELEICEMSNTFHIDIESSDVDTFDASTDDGKSISLDIKLDPLGDDIETQVLRDIANDIVGRNEPFQALFGIKAQLYADYTASGKALVKIETFLRNKVLPICGNASTTTSVAGLQTKAFREEARQIIATAVNASKLKDEVLFTGQGCTSAVQKLIVTLKINSVKRLRRPYKRPVIFTGPFAHHSNLLPWRESLAADVVAIPEAIGGGLDVKELERQLKVYSNRRLKIGTFTAASNLTGVLTDVDQISMVLHRHGALACWDYATCAPYVEIDMNPCNPLAYKDAIFFSGHKFIGGPGSPGVLVVKKKIMQNDVSTMSGCGSELSCTERNQTFLKDKLSQEEGAPAILGSIRLGLAFALKQRIGAEKIMDLERRHVQRVRETLGNNPHILLLGRHSDNVEQLPIFSIMVRCGDRFLHHNFVCALLNDLFGIQARGGCQCAGPYAARLLGISKGHTSALANASIEGKLVIKPGVVRMSFPYFIDESEIEYILDAMNFVANDGWKFLPQYELDIYSSRWCHESCAKSSPPIKSLLSDLDFCSEDSYSRDQPVISCIPTHRRENLERAARQADICIKEAMLLEPFPKKQHLSQNDEWLRWFVYPDEVVKSCKINGGKAPLADKITGPCQPHLYLENAMNHIWDGTVSMSEMKRSRMGRLRLLMLRF